jgi:hypothetical protein
MSTTSGNKVRWYARNIHKRIKADFLHNHDFFQVALSDISSAARNENWPLDVTTFYGCAVRYVEKGLVGLMEGDENAIEYLYHANYYQVAAQRHLFALFLAPPKTNRSMTSFNDFALALARAVVLGCRQDAEELAEILCTGLADIRNRSDDPPYVGKYCYFHGIRNSCVAPFILQLYSQARGIQFPLDLHNANPLASMQTYAPLFQLWQTTDMDALQQALFVACDTHLELSKYSTKYATLEFSRSTDMLYPAEILMLLRLREEAGLTTPAFDHPLLNTPVGHLYPVRSVPHPPDLDKALANCLHWIAVTYAALPTL